MWSGGREREKKRERADGGNAGKKKKKKMNSFDGEKAFICVLTPAENICG